MVYVHTVGRIAEVDCAFPTVLQAHGMRAVTIVDDTTFSAAENARGDGERWQGAGAKGVVIFDVVLLNTGSHGQGTVTA